MNDQQLTRVEAPPWPQPRAPRAAFLDLFLRLSISVKKNRAFFDQPHSFIEHKWLPFCQVMQPLLSLFSILRVHHDWTGSGYRLVSLVTKEIQVSHVE